ncbi:hypothetical protein ACGFH8_00150 [Micromonospora sp. NPDC049175]|uniref:hypothetical protein n=1 Tax=Micromonospora sp. NPDC049175 TaxID=3364266 RepID=UPI003713123B
MATGFGFDRDAVLQAVRQLTDVRSELESARRQTGQLPKTGSHDVDQALYEFTKATVHHQTRLAAAVAAAADGLNDVVTGHAQLDSALANELSTNQQAKGDER